MYIRAIYILHKNDKPSHFHDVIERKNTYFKLKRKSFRGLF